MFLCKKCQKKFKEATQTLIEEQAIDCCPHCENVEFEECEEFEKEFHKRLVRDRVPQNLKHQKIRYEASKITDKTQMSILLMENLEELITDLKRGYSAEILADMIEHIIAIGGINRLAWEDIMQHRRRKLERYGAFQHGVYLLWTEKRI